MLLVLVARPLNAQTESQVKAEGHRGNLGSRHGSGRWHGFRSGVRPRKETNGFMIRHGR